MTNRDDRTNYVNMESLSAAGTTWVPRPPYDDSSLLEKEQVLRDLARLLGVEIVFPKQATGVQMTYTPLPPNVTATVQTGNHGV